MAETLSRRARREQDQAEAYRLMLEGATVRDIAAELGVSRSTAHRLVTAGHEQIRAERSDELEVARLLELRRLDALHAALWDQAEAGDLRSIAAVLRISDRRCRLLGLYPSPTATGRRADRDERLDREVTELLERIDRIAPARPVGVPRHNDPSTRSKAEEGRSGEGQGSKIA